ncbi:3-hydroxyisobutyrate dehydrogenase, partial [Trifolium medium]|nr:3-hydroxyisobutyrate dehydrogenase [Trifolium medium]
CSDAYNPVPGLMEGVPSSKDYNGGFASKLMWNAAVQA